MTKPVVSIVLLISLNLFLGACDRHRPQPAPQPRETIIVSPPPAPPAPAPAPPPVLPAQGDHDGDGVTNAEDQCPTVVAGQQPAPSRPGCPDSDSDGDGVLDGSDRCPLDRSTQADDPDRDGCPNPPPETDIDAGTGGEADASASPTLPADAGTAPHSPTTPADAAVLTDAPPQADPVAAPPADAGNAPICALPPKAVGDTIDQEGRQRELANSFCFVTGDEVREVNASAPDAPCAAGVAGCWRRASANSTLPLPQEGTRGTFACTPDSPFRWRCGAGVTPCTPVIAAATWRLQHALASQRTRR